MSSANSLEPSTRVLASSTHKPAHGRPQGLSSLCRNTAKKLYPLNVLNSKLSLCVIGASVCSDGGALRAPPGSKWGPRGQRSVVGPDHRGDVSQTGWTPRPRHGAWPFQQTVGTIEITDLTSDAQEWNSEGCGGAGAARNWRMGFFGNCMAHRHTFRVPGDTGFSRRRWRTCRENHMSRIPCQLIVRLFQNFL